MDNFCTRRGEKSEAVGGVVELNEVDVRDGGLCREAIGGIDTVIHLAALHEVVRSVECPMETHEVNVPGTLNLLTAAREAGGQKLVVASSSALYGEHPVIPGSAGMLPAP